MKNEYKLLEMIEPPEDLKNSIIFAVKKQESRKTAYKIAVSSILSLMSVSTIAVFVVNIMNDAYQSGLANRISLIFSDGASIASYWQTYLLSLVDALPIMPISIIVASLSIFVWTVNNFRENFKDAKQLFIKSVRPV